MVNDVPDKVPPPPPIVKQRSMEVKAPIVLERLKNDAAIGTPCAVVRDNGTIFVSRTISEPFKAPAGYMVCFVKGIGGYYIMDRIYDATNLQGVHS